MMERKEYDMIEGYLDGTLDEASARELEAMAAEDPELAAELEAERTIRMTLARDAASLPATTNEPSALLIARLAATSGASGGAAAGSGGVLGTIFGTGTGLGVVTVVGLIGLTIGAIFFAENVEVAPSLPSPVQQEGAPTTTHPQHPQVGTVDGSAESGVGMISDDDDRAEGIAPATHQSERSSPSAPRTSATSTTTITSTAKNSAPTDDRSSLPTEDRTPRLTDPSSDNAHATSIEQEAQEMLDRINAEADSQTDPIPQVEGPSSTMEVRIEN